MILESLYSEMANLYGDSYNVRFLAQSLPAAEVVWSHLKEQPAFVEKKVDFIHLGAMPEYAQPLVIEALRPHKERLKSLIDSGTVVLCTGNAMEVFGQAIEMEDGTRVEGLGFFPTVARPKMLNRFNSLFLGKLEDIEVVGFQSQFAFSEGEPLPEPLFQVVKGAGIDKKSTGEGIRYHHFFGTCVLGPLLPLNPPFTRYLLRLLGVKEPTLAFEEEAQKAYEVRLAEFHRPDIQMEA